MVIDIELNSERQGGRPTDNDKNVEDGGAERVGM